MSRVVQYPCRREHAISRAREGLAVDFVARGVATAVAKVAGVEVVPAMVEDPGDRAVAQGVDVAMASLEAGVLALEVSKAAVAVRIRRGCLQYTDRRRQ